MREAVAGGASTIVLEFPPRQSAAGAEHAGTGEAELITATIRTAQGDGQRLLDAIAGGDCAFLLVSIDGRVSCRAELAVPRSSASECTTQGRLTVDWVRSSISVEGNQVALSRTELRLVAALLEGGGRAVSKVDLIRRAWPSGVGAGEGGENALAVYICGLRKRFAAAGLANSLETVRRTGYRLVL